MMVKFINANTGGVMYVAHERVDEYIKAGHKLAPLPSQKVADKKPRQKGKPKQGV